ncbi:MAG: APC family permease [Legionellaceae bacterium]|nr:APC family permease [Legionellaceae bacterium]
MPLKRAQLSLIPLVLLITGAIDSVRNLPTIALFGPTLIFFFVISAMTFLIPVALVSAELASVWSEEEGGIYSWVSKAFGKNWAFLTVWLQWVNTMVWYPTILSFIAGTLAYLTHPELAHNKGYLITVILVTFWFLTLMALRGLKVSARFASICAFLGMILPMGFIIFLGIVWITKGNTLAVNLHWSTLIPKHFSPGTLVSLTAMMTSFLGMELAAVHVRDVYNPKRNFPLAVFFSVILIVCTMVMGSLAIAVVIPAKDIHLVDGVMQAFTEFFAAYHLAQLTPLLVVLLLLGSMGSMVNWIISPAKGLLMAAQDDFLPHWFYKRNKAGVASRVLLAQALMVTVFCSAFMLFPEINMIYWLFTDLSTELYLLMYILMFLAAWRLKKTHAHLPRTFEIPGGRLGYYVVCILGLIGTGVALVVGFIPPQESMGVGGAEHFQQIFSLGLLTMILPALLFYGHRRRVLAGPHL